MTKKILTLMSVFLMLVVGILSLLVVTTTPAAGTDFDQPGYALIAAPKFGDVSHGNEALKKNRKSRKLVYQINFTQALSKSKGVFALLFHETKSKIMQLVADLLNIFQRTIEPVRPGRKYPRKHKVSARKFFLQYKPIG